LGKLASYLLRKSFLFGMNPFLKLKKPIIKVTSILLLQQRSAILEKKLSQAGRDKIFWK